MHTAFNVWAVNIVDLGNLGVIINVWVVELQAELSLDHSSLECDFKIEWATKIYDRIYRQIAPQVLRNTLTNIEPKAVAILVDGATLPNGRPKVRLK